LSPRLSTPLADEFQGMDVRPLLREIILHVIGVGTLDGAQAPQRRVIGVLLDQLRATGPLPLSIKLRATGARGSSPTACRKIPRIARRSTASGASQARARARYNGCSSTRRGCDSPRGASACGCCMRSRG